MESWLESLTPAQREAVQHVDGPLLILAGPGSGKTRVVTHRIGYLLEQGVGAGQILALTFTNKAAEEMSSRVDRLVSGAPVWMSTFHRFAARVLRDYASLVGLGENFTIYDTQDSRHVLRRVLDDIDIETTHVTPERIASAISSAKNRLLTAEEYAERATNPLSRIVAKVYPAYQSRLLASSAVDFDDLLLHVAQLLRSNPEVRTTLDARYRYILVDEYQDTNRAQYVILRALSVDYPNLAATGDPDQSIYGWRGADLNNILEFERDFPDVRIVRLERNYRSTQRIVRIADALIVHNKRRKPKELYTENDEGAPVRLVAYGTHKEEAEGIAARIAGDVQAGLRRPRDFAVFYRVNALSRAIEDALREQGIAYQMIHGQEFYQRKEIKDVLSYAQLVNNPRDDVAFFRVVNTPTRGIGRKTVDRLAEHAARRGLTMLEAARESGLVESLAKRAAVNVAKFVTMIDRISEVSAGAVEEVLGTIVSVSGLRDALAGSDAEEDQNRLANIEELLTAAREFDTLNPEKSQLETFLEQACLVNETDDWETETDKVTLMTVHAAKGLEFPVVFIVAAEEGLMPHERSKKDDSELEEERRLLFVGITRAAEQLQLSYAVYREFRGQRRRTVPSSFLMELPRYEMEMIESQLSSYATMSEWEMPTYQSEDAYQPGRSDSIPPGPTAGATSILTTAADMARDDPQVDLTAPVSLVPTDTFVQGMAVTHPEHGLGKIVALSGDGLRRKATVAFVTAGEKRFVLAKSPLRPAGR